MGIIGIRKEDKSRFERRAALDPATLANAVRDDGLQFVVESSRVRIFSDEDYAAAGATVAHDLEQAAVILGVKEIPLGRLLPGKTFVFFSHTIKGQKHNMPMLRKLMELKCTLIDYERIVDDKGRRLVFFGYYAGLAGMIDTLWALGQRLLQLGMETPLAALRQAFHYQDTQAACAAIAEAGARIAEHGAPRGLEPLVIGFTGSGNVSRGAQHVFDHLPHTDVTPADLPALFAPGAHVSDRTFYKVVFNEPDMAERTDRAPFVLQDYYDHPDRYRGIFDRHLPWLTGIVNCIYWDKRYPRIVTREWARALHAEGRLRLKVVGDISCDVDGSIEMTTRATSQEHPVLIYDPSTDAEALPGIGPGFAIMAVDNLPAELPADATRYFGTSLRPFLAALARLDRTASFDTLDIPRELRPAVIVWNGELTPPYKHLERFIS